MFANVENYDLRRCNCNMPMPVLKYSFTGCNEIANVENMTSEVEATLPTNVENKTSEVATRLPKLKISLEQVPIYLLMYNCTITYIENVTPEPVVLDVYHSSCLI